ncbi:hypothetical protein IQ247_13825 [Plectonema cf. radiosum LEGE 06105]|uniref:Uncharacterized protein n=1 Tax=Plectonema cf. radiosum LEGE 06105 TaxID=945769 RepID=A0A8J7FHB5_9CYAN|nr:hypothetical protein [Plectonema radiosum]MBE9213731.1 hypothetical protein [Plectonema cf. radiosum LEGE 06105]
MTNNHAYNKKLAEASYLTGTELVKLVDYIEEKFNTNRIRATLVVGVLVQSMQHQLETSNKYKKDIRELIDDLEIDVTT